MKKVRVVICVMTVLAVCISLAACGASGSSPAGGETTKAAEEKFAYEAEFKEFVTDSKNLLTVCGYDSGSVFYSCTEKVGESIPEGIVPDYEGQYDIYQTFLYRYSGKGNTEKIPLYKTIDAPLNEGLFPDYSSGSDLCGLCFTENGFVTVEIRYASWLAEDAEDNHDYSIEDGYEAQCYSQEYFIRALDPEGNELSCAPIQVSEDDWLDAERIQPDGRGNYVIPAGEGLRVIGPDGHDAYSISCEGYVEELFRLADGRLAAILSADERQLCILDTEKARLEPVTDIDYGASGMIAGGIWDYCYTEGDSFYGCDLGAEPIRLFNWTECGVNAQEAKILDVSSDGVVTVSINKYDEKHDTGSLELVIFRPAAGSDREQKESITLAVMQLDYGVQELVADFNRRNDRYRVEIIDYSLYDKGKDGSKAGTTVLTTEILSGAMPDILCLNGLNYRQLAASGILEDLYPYIDTDSTLDRSDFFPNVLSALETDGKLCCTVSGFMVDSAIGARSVVGDGPSWTYEQFSAALASMPEGCTAFDEHVTRYDVLSTCLALDMIDYVDWSSGEVRFDSPQFIQLLEFSSTFPDEYYWENAEFSGIDSLEERLSQGRQMLVQTNANSIDDFFYNNYASSLGDDITYIGYPTLHGTGSMLSFSGAPIFSITEGSEHKDAAWTFLRTLFTREYQSRHITILPSRLDLFEEKAAEAATVQYLKNEDGKYELNADGERIPISRYSVWDPMKNSFAEIYALSEEKIGQIRELVTGTAKAEDYDMNILDIVEEETAPFFAGQKTAAEVAKLVQSKVNLYVNEQR